MNSTFRLLSCAAVAIAALTSCAKEEFKENAIPAGEPIEVSISGQIGEFTPADATKATAESVVRVTWGSGDKVFVYDGSNASIGTLTVTPDNNNASYAMLSGTITASAASPSKLTLVYVKGATEAPAIAGGKISVDLSSQNAAEVPFVLYTTVAYDAAALTKTNEYISFDFATSVMTVNCTGLQTDEGTKISIDKAEIDGVSTVCELAVTGSGVTVAGAETGKITRTETAEPSVFTQSDSRGSFKLALAADPAAPAARNILVHQGSKVSGAPFTTATLAAGKSYNTVYQMGEYISNGAGGYSPAVKVSGVSLNKTETTIEAGATETLVANVLPANAANKQINWLSSNTSVATVGATSGEVTGVAAGSAVITATTADGNFTAVCLVTVTPPNPLYVLIAADYDNDPSTPNTTLKWYRQNLAISDSGKKAWKGSNSSAVKVPGVPGTEKDVIVGDYFQWAASYAGYNIESNPQEKDLLLYTSFDNTKCGDANDKFYTEGDNFSKSFSKIYAPYGGDAYAPYSKYENDGKTKLDASDDVVSIILEGTWRMPTTKEFQAMKGVTYWAWDATDCGYYVFKPGEGTSGTAGGRGNFDTSTDDKSKALLFFPAAGADHGTDLIVAGSFGHYWSSSLRTGSTDAAYYLHFDSDYVDPQNYSYRYRGFSVRPVSD